MEKQRILLKLILDKMDLGDLNLQSFQNRLKYQKKIYLLQLFGLDLGYRYNWHIHGPYCPSLTSDLFTLKEEVEVEKERDYENYKLKENFKRKTDQVKKLWRKKPDSVNDALWVELLASLHYLKHIAYWGKSKVGKKEVYCS